MQIENDITAELEQWGWWAQLCPSRALGFKSKVTLVPIKSDKTAVNMLTITDDRAMQIDKAIAKLLHNDDKAFKAIKLRFICGMGYRDIGKDLSISKDSARSMIENSTSWITGYLYSKID
jgi:hypothetical protein